MIYNYRIDIIRSGAVIGNLKARNCSICFNSDAEVMRGAKLSIYKGSANLNKTVFKVDGFYFDGEHYFNGNWTFKQSIYEYGFMEDFNLFTDRIRPVLIRDGVESSLGVYMIISSPEVISDNYNYYDIEAYDETMILKQTGTEDRVFFAQGTKYIDIITSFLTQAGFSNVIIDRTDLEINRDIEYEIGESYISIINGLLDEINYNHVYANMDGNIVISSKKEKLLPDFIYRDKTVFNILKPLRVTTDIYNLPNVLIGIASNPDTREPIIYKKVNNDLGSRISVVNRGYKVVKKYRLNDVASENVLKDYIDSKYLETTQTTETLDFETAIEPAHELNSYIQISTNILEGFFVEKEWSLDLDVKATMKHRAERRTFI